MPPQGSSRRRKRKCWFRFVSLDLRDARGMPVCDWVECGSAWETAGCNNQYIRESSQSGASWLLGTEAGG